MVFALDTSFSIRRAGLWPELRNFAARTSSMLNIGLDQSLVGLIRFAGDADLIFNVLNYTNNDTLIPAILSVPAGRGQTRTDNALRLLRQSGEDGRMGLRDGVPHIAVIVTDGRSRNRGATIRQAERLHESNIYQVYAAGIGVDISMEELEAIASSPSLVFLTNETTNVTAIQQIEQSISEQLCRRQCEFTFNAIGF